MTAPHRIGVLSTRSHPLLPYFLERLAAVPDLEPVVLLDDRDFSAKDAGLFAERTAGAFPPRDPASLLARLAGRTVASHNAPECVAVVRAGGLEVLVNAGTPRRLGPELLAAPAIGVLNVHPGILPKYRGASCCEWAIHQDDPVGVTAHFMDEGLDSGPIIFAEPLPVRRGQTYTELRTSLYRLELDVRVRALERIFALGLRPELLPRQPDAPVFKPMPPDLVAAVKAKLARGEYRHAA